MQNFLLIFCREIPPCMKPGHSPVTLGLRPLSRILTPLIFSFAGAQVLTTDVPQPKIAKQLVLLSTDSSTSPPFKQTVFYFFPCFYSDLSPPLCCFLYLLHQNTHYFCLFSPRLTCPPCFVIGRAFPIHI